MVFAAGGGPGWEEDRRKTGYCSPCTGTDLFCHAASSISCIVQDRQRCTRLVYTKIMRNVTFSADEELIDKARLRARVEKKTLNEAFREWLQRYAGKSTAAAEYQQLMRRLSHVKAGGPYTRDEMNAR